MKKFYLAAIALMAGVSSMFAQTETGIHFVTIDENGAKIADVADGATINVSDITVDDFQGNYISSGLGVENTSDSGKRLQLMYMVESMPSGKMQACVFGSCTTATAESAVYYAPALSSTGHHISLSVLKSGRVQDLAAEWFPGGEGSATATFTILVGTKTGETEDTGEEIYDVVEGPSVTVNFLNGVSGISDVFSADVVSTEYFDMTGRKVSAPSHGVYIVRTRTAAGKVATAKMAVK